MRRLVGTTLASLMLAGASVVTIIPSAFADDAGIHDFMNQGTSSTTPAQPNSNSQQYRATYADPGVSRTQTAAPTVEKDPAYFYHAQGTMSSQ